MRVLLYSMSGLYALLGAILFVAPAWSAAHFAWKVSPFVAMTIGGWCLGNAWSAFVTAGRPWATAFTPALYLACFGVLEAAVTIAFSGVLRTADALAWLYLATLAVNVVFAAVFIANWLREGGPNPVGTPLGPTQVVLSVIFVMLVGFLGLYGLLAVEGMPALNGGIFPERMSMFTLRSFGAFYFALALSTIPLLFARGRANLLTYAFAQYSLIVFITLAALVFIGQFDFAARPTQAAYIGVYVLVGAVVAFYLLRYGTGKDSRA